MLVLSRQVDEAVMIGDAIMVTVVSIRAEMATLFVRYCDANQRVEQKLALEKDDRLEITDDVHVYVVDIRGDKVRLGVVAPAAFSVHRREVYEAIQRENKAAVKVHLGAEKPTDVWKLPADKTLRIGRELRISFTPAAPETSSLHSIGEMMGGPKDGQAIDRHDAISVGTTLDFGTLVRICVVGISTREIGLKIEHPTHMLCRIEN